MTLESSGSQSLLEAFGALLVDIDGVVVLGDEAIPGAVEALNQARQAEVPAVFVTNNAARPPAELVRMLGEAGLDVGADRVMTAALAAADLLRRDHGAGAGVLVVGGPGLHEAVAAAGLRVLQAATAEPVAVVQGWGPDVGWRELAEATLAVRAGARWVATNLDRTLPTPRGLLPGSGALVAAVATALGRQPDVVVGKPYPALLSAAQQMTGDRRALVVGDRLDTDVAGAVAAELPALFVLSGVSTAADLLAAPAAARPSYIGADLRSVADVHPAVTVDGATARCRASVVRIDSSDAVEVCGTAEQGDGLDPLRALAALAWTGTLPPSAYEEALRTLDLS